LSEQQTTEKASAKDEDLDLDADERSLLAFAETLSFDKFIGDIEVKSIVDRLKKRVADLERDVEQEGQRAVDAEERAMKREMLAALVRVNGCCCALPVRSLFMSAGRGGTTYGVGRRGR
jgi:hypothetical protein